eukprot:6332967-Karenia_brevis.AAC.1
MSSRACLKIWDPMQPQSLSQVLALQILEYANNPEDIVLCLPLSCVRRAISLRFVCGLQHWNTFLWGARLLHMEAERLHGRYPGHSTATVSARLEDKLEQLTQHMTHAQRLHHRRSYLEARLAAATEAITLEAKKAADEVRRKEQARKQRVVPCVVVVSSSDSESVSDSDSDSDSDGNALP